MKKRDFMVLIHTANIKMIRKAKFCKGAEERKCSHTVGES